MLLKILQAFEDIVLYGKKPCSINRAVQTTGTVTFPEPSGDWGSAVGGYFSTGEGDCDDDLDMDWAWREGVDKTTRIALVDRESGLVKITNPTRASSRSISVGNIHLNRDTGCDRTGRYHFQQPELI